LKPVVPALCRRKLLTYSGFEKTAVPYKNIPATQRRNYRLVTSHSLNCSSGAMSPEIINTQRFWEKPLYLIKNIPATQRRNYRLVTSHSSGFIWMMRRS
jgi:hypothetical protein